MMMCAGLCAAGGDTKRFWMMVVVMMMMMMGMSSVSYSSDLLLSQWMLLFEWYVAVAPAL